MQDFLAELIERYRYNPCILCGEIHPLEVHCYPKRKVRCPQDRTNKTILIVSIICLRAKEQCRQYTKRILPEFVIPECNIRHDRVLLLQANLQGDRIDYGEASKILGTVCERTIRRHLQWAQQIIAETLVQASQLLAMLVSFGVLPDSQVGESAYGQLLRLVEQLSQAARRMGGQRGEPLTERTCTHRVYCYRRSRKELDISLNLVFKSILIFDTS